MAASPRPAVFEHRDEPRISLSLSLASTYFERTSDRLRYGRSAGKKQTQGPGERPPPKLLKLGKVVFLAADAGTPADTSGLR
jgi:hypothetical protein